MKAHPERIASWFTELGDLEGVWRTTLHLAVWSSGTPEGRACLLQAGVTQTSCRRRSMLCVIRSISLWC